MIAAQRLHGPLIRSLSAEFSRRGTVHHAEAAQFPTSEGPVQAVRWALSMTDSDDDFGTQLISALLEDAAHQVEHPGVSVTTTVLAAQHRPIDQMMLVMDVDSTLIDQEVIDLLAAHAGRETEVAAVTERAMRGELDFAQSLHARVQTLAGLPESVLLKTVQAVTATQGAHELLAALRHRDAPCYAVSGGFRQILEPLAHQLGLTGYDANLLELKDGRLTGRVTGQVVDRSLKRQRMLEWAAQHAIPQENIVAIGDGANDVDMVNAAGVGVAFCAKRALSEQADLVIRHRNLALTGWALGLSHEQLTRRIDSPTGRVG